jgi:hypothetical protein
MGYFPEVKTVASLDAQRSEVNRKAEGAHVKNL